MSTTEVAYLVVFLVVALAPTATALWRVRGVRGDALVLSKKRILVVLAVMTPLLLLSSVVFFLSLPILAFTIALVLKPKVLGPDDLQGQSAVVLGNLTRIQGEIAETGIHLQHLSTTIQTSQAEIAEKEERRFSLQKEIDRHLADVEAWQALSAEQRELFVGAASEAMRRRTFCQMVAVVGGGLALNVAAAFIWALLGSPGKDQLIEYFRQIFS